MKLATTYRVTCPIRNGTLKSFVLLRMDQISIFLSLLFIDYFLLWVFYKSDSGILLGKQYRGNRDKGLKDAVVNRKFHCRVT